MHPSTTVTVLAFFVGLSSCGSPSAPSAPGQPRGAGAGSAAAEWAGAQDAPEELSWSTTIAPAGEPGEPLELSGRLLHGDGSPAAGALLYVYHANAAGAYPTRGDERGHGVRHGYLRGWMRTGADGRYRFRTVRPGGYPGRPDPAHVHATVTVPGQPERWIDSYWFEGDPRITEAMRARRTGRGGTGATVALRRGADGVWRGVRDIVLDG